MLRSLEQVAYSMRNQADKIGVTANNIANITTRAYKKESIGIRSFDDYLVEAVNYNSGYGKVIGSINFGSEIGTKKIDFSQGSLDETGIETDFALNGDGFFAIETPRGIEYTRAGNFRLNNEGYLVTQSGGYVLGEAGRIYVPDGVITVDRAGNINNGDRFLIVAFGDTNLLRKSGEGNFINEDPANIRQPESCEVWQGYLEASNVDVVSEVRDLLSARRNYESCQQIIKMLDNTLGKAVSEIGSV